jgi:uncharacterized membrane protein YidH (DUF202 family)
VVKKRFKEVNKWGWLAAINFAIPQIYILYYAHHASRETLLIFALAITGLALSSAYTLWSQVKKSRKSQ